jgi:two-component system cell cycle response regulator DivK
MVSSSAATICVLVVDDNDTNRQLACAILESKGFVCIEASTGAGAIEMVNSHAPDLVLLDIQLPDISGLEVLARIRAASDLAVRHVKVIAATALAFPKDRALCLGSGCDGYLARPYSSRDLLTTISNVLAGSTDLLSASSQ